MGKEPTLIIQAVVAALNAAQVLLVTVPSGVHAGIAIASIGLGALINRSQVVPTSKLTGGTDA